MLHAPAGTGRRFPFGFPPRAQNLEGIARGFMAIPDTSQLLLELGIAIPNPPAKSRQAPSGAACSREPPRWWAQLGEEGGEHPNGPILPRPEEPGELGTQRGKI